MIKRIYLFLLVALSVTAYAQQGTLKGNIDTKNFPEVSFVWNEYNPDTLSVNQFSIKENGKEAIFTSQNLVADSIPQKNKTILFLWEDQPIRENQFNFTASLLYYFLTENMLNDTTTTFNVAVFNQKQGDEPALKLKFDSFTSDKELLKTFITTTVSHDNTRLRNNPEKSDLLLAVKEGLDLIGKEAKENTRAIVVITAGLFIDGEKLPVINQSLQNRIPVYVIYYPTSKGESKNVIDLSTETYGQFVRSDGSDTDFAKATREELLKIVDNLNSRHYGQDYKITFTSQLERDGSSAQIVVNNNQPTPYKTPNFSLFVWAKAHLIWFIVLLVIFLAAVTLGAIFGYKFIREKLSDIKEQKQEEESKKQQQQAEQRAMQRKLNETQEALKRQQKIVEQEKQQVQQQEETEKLARLMRTKNLQPRLLSVNSSEMFNISNVTTTIGRNDDNDIALPDGSVSKHHAQIVFNGVGFEILDLNSSNGIIVNGQSIENAELKSGDIIQLGETVMKFYI